MAEQKSPFGTSGAGASAFKAAYDRLKAEAEARKQGITQDYASAYQQLRGQQYTQGLGAAAQRGLSGGQAVGTQQAVTAQQMGQLGNLMQGQERALREAKVGEGAIYSNALLEGQQAQEMESARLAQINAILTKPDGKPKKVEDLTPIERQQLEALNYNIPTTTNKYKRPLGVKSLDMYSTLSQSGIFYEQDANGNVVGYKMVNGVKTPVSSYNPNQNR